MAPQWALHASWGLRLQNPWPPQEHGVTNGRKRTDAPWARQGARTLGVVSICVSCRVKITCQRLVNHLEIFGLFWSCHILVFRMVKHLLGDTLCRHLLGRSVKSQPKSAANSAELEVSRGVATGPKPYPSVTRGEKMNIKASSLGTAFS